MNHSHWEVVASLLFTWSLFGLIWFIQLTHYPSFKFIHPNQFLQFHEHHTQTISFIVVPLMLGELFLSFWLVFQYRLEVIPWICLILVICIWVSTFTIQVPIHNALVNGKNEMLITQLVNTNWIRTILWTLKAILVTYYSLK